LFQNELGHVLLHGVVPFRLHFADAFDESVGGDLFVVDSHGALLYGKWVYHREKRSVSAPKTIKMKQQAEKIRVCARMHDVSAKLLQRRDREQPEAYAGERADDRALRTAAAHGRRI
jgi:hypothetical protein